MKYLSRKLLSFLITLVVISLITFIALQVLPGDPAVLVLGTEGDLAALEQLRESMGLYDPLWVRYYNWISGVLQGDFGQSIRYGVPVSKLIIEGLPVTLVLAILGITFSLIISIPLGVSCAVNRGMLWSSLGLGFSQLGMAIPAFWMGILLIQLFSVHFRIFPGGGYDSLVSLVLPAIALSLPRAAILTRIVRASFLEILTQDYIRTARSKGLLKRSIIYKHALRNASINIFTVAGIYLTQLLAGTIVIEQVFGLPGLGQLLLAAVLQRDIPLVQGLVIIGATMILLANLIFDIVLGLLDPRIRFQ